MLAKRIIPCLDVDAGRVVKGVQFVDIGDAGDPVEAVRLRPDRLEVISKGKVVSRKIRNDSRLAMPGRPETVRRRHTAGR